MAPLHPWLARLRHDLVKRAAWPARDLREGLESGSPAWPADLEALRAGMFSLQAEDGSACDAGTLWRSMRISAPPSLDARAVAAFGEGVEAALAAVARAVPNKMKRAAPDGDGGSTESSGAQIRAAVEAVLALEALFANLAGKTKSKEG